MNDVIIDGHSLSLEQIYAVAHQKTHVRIGDAVETALTQMREHIDVAASSGQAYYGINTGFGALAEHAIPKRDLEKLQHHLILSHAVGTGAPLSIPQARALMLLRANTLAVGHSGVRPELVQMLVDLLNAKVSPYVPCKGSIGASGDLAPLAHLGMLLIGEGRAFAGSDEVSAKIALENARLKPITLRAKEGLALINGTQAMAAIGSLALYEAEYLCELADQIGSCSLVALDGRMEPFDARIHHARPHPGQIASAQNIRDILQGRFLDTFPRVQDPYSLRCMPQVHGATRDALKHVRDVLEREINSATDNPLIFTDGKEIEILSGGNFHGQPLALALDYLAIATAELANISERRVEQLINPALSAGLPAFLTPAAGINSGFMILQVTAAALVNENKILSHPASTDSIPTSANREDHVSMGMTSANKATQIIENVRTVLAIELMCACQALDLRAPKTPGKAVLSIKEKVRKHIPFAQQDRAFGNDLTNAIAFCQNRIL